MSVLSARHEPSNTFFDPLKAYVNYFAGLKAFLVLLALSTEWYGLVNLSTMTSFFIYYRKDLFSERHDISCNKLQM